MKRIILITVSLICASVAAFPQETPSAILKRVVSIISQPKEYLDSAYVFQAAPTWVVGVEGKGLFLGADLDSDLSIQTVIDGQVTVYNGDMETGLRNEPYRKLGFSAGYGPIRVGYGRDLAKKRGDHSKYFSLASKSSFYGVEVEYYNVKQFPEGTLTFEGTEPVDLSSDYLGKLRNFYVDAFYAFNRRRFDYTTAYGGWTFQRRSAGSWMATAQYSQGDFSFNGDDPLLILLNGLKRYSTQQVSIGGGYSYNWVFLHRDPHDQATYAGLRNLTFNATALPMLSFYNHLQTEQDTSSGLMKVRYPGRPTIAVTLRSALGYTFGRCSVNLCADYEQFSFRGVKTEISGENSFYMSIKTRGAFHDLSIVTKVDVRF